MTAKKKAVKQKEPKKMGAPRIELEDMSFDGWDLLDKMVAFGNEADCAIVLGISEDTLVRRIKERTGLTFAEMRTKKRGQLKARLWVTQYELALSGNPTMLVWLGKQELGQKDQVQTDSTIKVKTIEDLINEKEKEDQNGQ